MHHLSFTRSFDNRKNSMCQKIQCATDLLRQIGSKKKNREKNPRREKGDAHQGRRKQMTISRGRTSAGQPAIGKAAAETAISEKTEEKHTTQRRRKQATNNNVEQQKRQLRLQLQRR
jgi:hypothetical protein